MTKPAAPRAPRPTEAELEILGVLWEHGPSTVRSVHHHLGARTGYTTILKLMQIMMEKGLLAREAEGRGHVYRPASDEAHTQRRIVNDLLTRAFGGSARKLVLAALSARKTSPQEIDEIKRLLEEYKGGSR